MTKGLGIALAVIIACAGMTGAISHGAAEPAQAATDISSAKKGQSGAARAPRAARQAGPRAAPRNVGQRNIQRNIQQRSIQRNVQQRSIQRNIQQRTIQQRTIQRSGQQRNIQQRAIQQNIGQRSTVQRSAQKSRFGRVKIRNASRTRVDGRNYSIWRGSHRVRRGGQWRTFVALSTLGAIVFGTANYYPYAYIDAPAPYCEGLTEDGCQLQWREVPTLEGPSEFQCVAYCPWQ